MPPSGLAILIGAGPTSGAGVARVLANPKHGNLAVALLARNEQNLRNLAEELRQTSEGGILHAFPTDTAPANLTRTFRTISEHHEFKGLKLRVAVWHVKHSSKKPFLEESPQAFGDSLQVYATGAVAFAQEALRMMYSHNGGETSLADSDGEKKGTIIFTGTLGSLRTNAEFTAYGAGRASVRMIAQSLAKEHSRNGIHVVHTIANGPIIDSDDDETRQGKKMSAEAVGQTYLWLSRQDPTLWIHEMDLRPAQEKF